MNWYRYCPLQRVLIPLSATEQPYHHSVTLLLIDGMTTTIEDMGLPDLAREKPERTGYLIDKAVLDALAYGL
jgi:hypothetical protein